MEVWEHDTWTNPNIPYIFNRQITEYDIQSAGLSLIKEYRLLSDSMIKKLDAIPTKEERNIRIGLLERKNKSLVEGKKQAFVTARKEFMLYNSLEQNDIISIKKDAIFTSVQCKKTQIGEYINFREKNVYTSFMKIGKRKLELYYGDHQIDVKGMSDENAALHEEGMTELLIHFFSEMEIDSPESILRYLRRMIDRYKKYDLPVAYYREYNTKSAFVTKDGEEFMDWSESDKTDLDISYNYFIICNLCKILL